MTSKVTTRMMLVRALCAVALILVAFGHRPLTLVGPDHSTFDLAQYVLPDGSLPVLCATDADGSGPSHHYGTPACDACLVSASFILPCPATIAGPKMQATAALLPPRFESVYHRLFPPSAPPRGPPSVIAA